MEKTRIVIVGGGFGGIYTLKNLQSKLGELRSIVEIVVISKENYFEFSPMLHEVATGGLDSNNVVEPIREMLDEYVTFIKGEVTHIDLEERELHLIDKMLHYDYLVLATGATTNYFGIENAEKHTLPIKTLKDSINIKNSIIEYFEKYSKENNEKIKIAIVGGGPTGVELAVETAELVHETLVPEYNNVECSEIDIKLLTGGFLLSMFSEHSQQIARGYLNKMNIEVLDDKVIEVKESTLVLENDEKIPFNLAIWAAGVKALIPKVTPEIEMEHGRVAVEKTLQIRGYPTAYALGDIAAGWPMLAQIATKQAPVVAENIIKAIKNKKPEIFEYEVKIQMLSLGQKNGIGEFGNLRLNGVFVWFLWRTVYLSKIISSKKKIKIALNWTFNLFAKRDISKI